MRLISEPHFCQRLYVSSSSVSSSIPCFTFQTQDCRLHNFVWFIGPSSLKEWLHRKCYHRGSLNSIHSIEMVLKGKRSEWQNWRLSKNPTPNPYWFFFPTQVVRKQRCTELDWMSGKSGSFCVFKERPSRFGRGNGKIFLGRGDCCEDFFLRYGSECL